MSTSDHGRHRTEPRLGNLDHLDAPSKRPPPADDLPRVRAGERPARAPRRSRTPPHRAPSRLRSWLWPLLTILVVAILALAWVNQDRLRALLPRTHLNSMLVHADQALAAGHLEGSDGTSARELYARVLQQEPDNSHALRGLHQVGEAELARASSAIKAGHDDAAARHLANARRLLGGGAGVEKVAHALQAARHPPEHNAATIERARKALAAGKITGPQGAAALYRQVLKGDPDNAVARHGLGKAGDQLAARADAALDQGDLATAAALVGELGQSLPHDGDLPALRARLSQARQASRDAIQAHLQKGQAYLRQGHFTGNGGDNALAEFQAVLQLDPDNQQAQDGRKQVAQALVLRATAALDSQDAVQARSLLDQATKLAPHLPDLALARSRLAAMAPPSGAKDTDAASSSAATDTVTAHPPLSPLQQVEIRQLVKRARNAADAGHFMLPPGDSAYDLYREALTIDANNAAARRGLQALPDAVSQRFDQALAAHRLQQAGEYLDTLRSLDPGGERARPLGKRLADAWLDRAQAHLDEGDHQAARKALDAARRINPDDARIKVLAVRLRNG